MARLKIGAINDDTPVKLTVVLPAAVHRDLVSYAQAMSKESGQAVEPTQLVAPMLLRFMATDRVFAKWRRIKRSAELGPSDNRHVSGTGTDDTIER
jgi:hypothetical protein